MGNEPAKPAIAKDDIPEEYKIKTVSEQPLEELDSVLLQLYNCPDFGLPILETPGKRFIIDTAAILHILDRYQSMIALSSKAIGNEQRLLQRKIFVAEQMALRASKYLATQNAGMKFVESKLSEVDNIVASVHRMKDTTTKIRARLDELEELLQPR